MYAAIIPKALPKGIDFQYSINIRVDKFHGKGWELNLKQSEVQYLLIYKCIYIDVYI